MRLRLPLSLAAMIPVAVLAVVVCPRCEGQGTGGVPDLRYFAGIDALYSGDHRDAARIFRRGQNRSIRIGTERWVDSICYSAMLGEVYFQLGANDEALAEFNVACQLYLQNPAWLLRVKFQNPPRPDVNRARRDHPPWGRSERQFTLGQIPSIMLVSRGRLQTAEELKRQRVTVVEPPMHFKLHVPEIIRCTALAIRRRNELLGPLAKPQPRRLGAAQPLVGRLD